MTFQSLFSSDARSIPVADKLSQKIRSLQPGTERLMSTIAKRSHVVKRHLSHGGIAGVVIGCIVFAVALIILYPFVRRGFSKRQPQDGPALDTESGMSQVPRDGADSRRLSSSGSLKREEGETSRGDLGGGVSQGGGRQRSRQMSGQSRQLPASGPEQTNRMPERSYEQDPTLYDGSGDPSSPFAREFYPANTPPAEGLSGSNADYYSANIPSEAFGMMPEDEEYTPEPISRRTSSLRQNFMHMIHRKSTHDKTGSPATSKRGSQDHSYTSGPQLENATPQRFITPGDAITASPITASPATLSMPAPPVPAAERAVVSPGPVSGEGAGGVAATPPQSPPLSRSLPHSPSPPQQPAPGTVNPMEIMPPSGRDEHYYLNEQELTVFGLPPTMAPQFPNPDHTTQDFALDHTAQGNHFFLPTDDVSASLVNAGNFVKPEPVEEDAVMNDFLTVNDNFNASSAHGHDRRHSVVSSIISSPLIGAPSTVASENTPATQLDTPSPPSGHDSDFQHSVSPQIGANVASPRDGLYYCNEPGCTQSFDQSHKLKHHQRYHTRSHKCPYPDCSLGFGTTTHLQRHINDKHERKKKFHCAVAGCDYSRQGGKGFPRKDNWKRHMTNMHQFDQADLPEPVEVIMGGT